MDKIYGLKEAMYEQVRREEMSNARQTEFKLSLSSVLSFLKRVKDAKRSFPEDVYSVFTLDPINIMHLGISKLLNNCVISHVGSNGLYTR